MTEEKSIEVLKAENDRLEAEILKINIAAKQAVINEANEKHRKEEENKLREQLRSEERQKIMDSMSETQSTLGQTRQVETLKGSNDRLMQFKQKYSKHLASQTGIDLQKEIGSMEYEDAVRWMAENGKRDMFYEGRIMKKDYNHGMRFIPVVVK